eukprot:m.362350 g.362350  ORF g.362350 m.362350 type:complete len:451 (-) comp20387_c0_seq1:248-1600(-)
MADGGAEPRRRRRKQAVSIPNFDKDNWLIYQLFVQKNFAECEKVIQNVVKLSQGQCAYAMLVKGLMLRQQGKLQLSLATFQGLSKSHPNNPTIAQHVGRSLYLLGRQQGALAYYEEAIKLGLRGWRIHYNRSVCLLKMGEIDEAEQALGVALKQPNVLCLVQLANVRLARTDMLGAIDAYEQAKALSPEEPELLIDLGLLYLQVGKPEHAFELFGAALAYDATNCKGILAASSIIQSNEDYDVALVKYRVAAVRTPESAEMWNNIGMAFFGKRKYVAAISCLKRAAYLAPFEWIISFNLGLVHLKVDQPVSAFHFFNTTINLKPSFAPAYSLLAAALVHLEDFKNADVAFRKALELDNTDASTHLNYASMLLGTQKESQAAVEFRLFQKIVAQDPELLKERPELKRQAAKLERQLAGSKPAQVQEKQPIQAKIQAQPAARHSEESSGIDV